MVLKTCVMTELDLGVVSFVILKMLLRRTWRTNFGTQMTQKRECAYTLCQFGYRNRVYGLGKHHEQKVKS